MASALTILLGCWLAGWSRVSGQGSYPKPSISVSPGGVIPVGGNVIIRCRHQLLGMRILLYKDGAGNYPTYTDPAGSEAEFPITSTRWEHRGSYTCRYSDRTDPPAYSEPSDPVQIIVADPRLPRPSISLSPTWVTAPGADVTIRCEGQRWDVTFFLHKAGDLNPQRHMDPAVAGAEFRIPSVGRQHGGSYSCSYRPRSEPFVSSQPSDPVQLVVAEPSYPKPSISLRPSGGVSLAGAMAIRCRGQRQGVRFVLNKEGRHFPPVDSDGFEAEFSSSNIRREDGGNYSCSYHSRSEPFAVSYPSDPVELVVRDPSLPRPFISLSPTGVTAPGADVTIRCQGQRRDVRFFLHKAGDLNPQRHMDPAGAGAEFRIPSVGRQHGGNYSCSYRPRSEPFVSSYVSSSVELVVAGGTDLTHPGAAPTPTRPGSAGPGGSESPAPLGLPSPIIAGVSAAAAGLLLLLLLVAFVCFRKTRARKGAARRLSSTSPLVVLKAPAQQDPVYASVDEGKEPQTLEPDPDGLTYAELNHQALQAKRGGLAPDPDPAQPSVYAAINVSQGGPLQ